MKKILCILLLMIQQHLIAWEKLDDKYCVSFGNPNAKNRITEYFSLACPHCLALFKSDFFKIKEKLIDAGKVYWIFHPVPVDMQTIQFMMCLQKLSLKEKRMFLEVILEEACLDEPDINSQLMQKAMEAFKKSIPELREENFIKQSSAFNDAFEFLKQENHLQAVPTVEINGKLFPSAIPKFSFVEEHLEKD